MTTTLLSAEDIHHIVHQVGLDALMDEMIERLITAIEGFDPDECRVRDRDGYHYTKPELGLIEWMPVLHLGDKATIKVVGYHPANPSVHNLPTILSTVSVYDAATGHLRALADGTFLTALRTGAASAVATKYLAHPEASVLGLVGCGAQALTQLHALSRIVTLREVLVHDRDPASAAAFLDYAQVLGLDVTFRDAPLAEILANADIVCTATSVGIGEGPVFADLPTKPWVHINAAGSDFPGKVELPYALLARSFVCPDQRAQCLREGECQQLVPEEIGPELLEVVKHPAQYAHVRTERSVFDSTGWALEDDVAMTLLLDHAQALGRGTAMQLESIAPAPKNPYFFMQGKPAVLAENGSTTQATP